MAIASSSDRNWTTSLGKTRIDPFFIHEFEHLIGNCDEYNTRKYMDKDVAGHYDKNPFTTNSIMNNTSESGLIFVRHYYSIKAVLEEWLNLPEDSTQIWWPGCSEGPPQAVSSVVTI